MKIYYEEKDMVTFGEYLLSKQRTDLISSNREGDSIPLEDRLRQIYHADFENWKHLEQKKPDAPQSFLFNNN